MIQLRVLTKTNQKPVSYTEKYITGQAVQATRGQSETDGAVFPLGGTVFVVPTGTVVVGNVIELKGQYFKVTGLEPVPPWFIKENLITEQTIGQFRMAILEFHALSLGDNRLALGDNVLGLEGGVAQ